jgi:hypothetical protein
MPPPPQAYGCAVGELRKRDINESFGPQIQNISIISFKLHKKTYYLTRRVSRYSGTPKKKQSLQLEPPQITTTKTEFTLREASSS